MAMLEHIKDIGERTEKKLDDHILRDEKITEDFTLPLWNAYQRRKGAAGVTPLPVKPRTSYFRPFAAAAWGIPCAGPIK